MTDQEFLQRFDVLYNNITSNQAPGLNVHEICVFLTKGQDEIVKDYFNPKGNKYGEGFDGNQKRQIDFSMITKVANISSFNTSIYDDRSNSKSAALPSDIMMIVNEKLTVTRGNTTGVKLVVRPLQFDEYDRLMSKPFKRPLRDQAWRLIINDAANKADLVVGPTDNITNYTIRYVKKPKPIIVGPLDGLTIDGYCYTGDSTPIPGSNPPATFPETSGCELDPMLHEEILQRAVELAKVAWTATGQDNAQMVLQAGQRSE